MLTSIIGYPRIGAQRELKFATEKYFRNEITLNELAKEAQNIREEQWKLQKSMEIDFIPSNDFSFCDQFLDTAVLFNIIPERYRNLQLSPADTYFAMTRGYQGKKGDVKALAMKKWFNTNYHYMVAEIEDDTQISLTGSKPFDEYLEAKALGIETKPVLTGPFTLLKLLHCCGKKRAEDFASALAESYEFLLQRFETLGARWVAFDEPALVLDLTTGDCSLLVRLYQKILSGKGNVKVLLQTYFGHIKDCYLPLTKLPLDGIGLDFIEGGENFHLIEKYGFPEDKLLFAGLVNGKNIWKNEYSKTLNILFRLKLQAHTVLGTSCSLLHVPYTLKNEENLSETYKAYFSFAEEKLQELGELKTLTESFYENSPLFVKNAALFKFPRPDSFHADVQKRVALVCKSDFTRNPSFEKREKLQKKQFQLPLFPTTTIGSFPQTLEVKRIRNAYKKGTVTEEEYLKFIREEIRKCIRWQEKTGLDVLVHGEYERNDMVEYFGEQLKGFLFTEKGWVQSYGTRCVKPPVIWGDVSRTGPMTVAWSVYAQSLTDKPVKGMLTGPVTILNWSFPREDLSMKDCACQIALAIRDEVLDLEKNGIKIIQIDEAALREKLPLRKEDRYPLYLDWAIPAFRLVHSGVSAETQIHTHMCYSDFTDIIPAIDQMDADVITFEASRSNLEILNSLKENHFRTEVGPGVYDIHSPRVPGTEEIRHSLDSMLEKIAPEKLWVNPDCGLKTRGVKETRESLKNMVTAARKLRKEKRILNE